MPVYTATGARINYTAEEQGATGNTITLGGDTYGVAVTGTPKDGFVITNSYNKKEVEVTFSAVEKGTITPELAGAVFELASNEAGAQPQTWTTTADQKKLTLKEGTYTLTETTAPTAIGTKTFTKAAPITFSITGDGKVTVDGVDQKGTITVLHRIGATSIAPTAKHDKIVVQKVWSGLFEYDATDAPEVTMQLLKGDDKTPVPGATVTLNSDNKWTDTFPIPVEATDSTGKTIVYSVEEVGTEADGTIRLDGYPFTVTTEKVDYVKATDGKEGFYFKVTNTYKPEAATVKFDLREKTKAHNGDLLAGYNLEVTEQTASTQAGAWESETTTKTLSLMPGKYVLQDKGLADTKAKDKYHKAEDIVFEVTANGKVMVNGEEAEDNTVTMEKALKTTSILFGDDEGSAQHDNIDVDVVWEGKFTDGTAPEVTALLANGDDVIQKDGNDVSLALNKDNTWKGSFEQVSPLAKAADGKMKPVEYKIVEVGVDDENKLVVDGDTYLVGGPATEEVGQDPYTLSSTFTNTYVQKVLDVPLIVLLMLMALQRHKKKSTSNSLAIFRQTIGLTTTCSKQPTPIVTFVEKRTK